MFQSSFEHPRQPTVAGDISSFTKVETDPICEHARSLLIWTVVVGHGTARGEAKPWREGAV